jgi:hypothetical protein
MAWPSHRAAVAVRRAADLGAEAQKAPGSEDRLVRLTQIQPPADPSTNREVISNSDSLCRASYSIAPSTPVARPSR